MTKDELEQRLVILEDWVSRIAKASEAMMVNHVGWMTALQSVLTAVNVTYIENSEDPDGALENFKNKASEYNRAAKFQNDEGSKIRYREAAELHLKNMIGEMRIDRES